MKKKKWTAGVKAQYESELAMMNRDEFDKERPVVEAEPIDLAQITKEAKEMADEIVDREKKEIIDNRVRQANDLNKKELKAAIKTLGFIDYDGVYSESDYSDYKEDDIYFHIDEIIEKRLDFDDDPVEEIKSENSDNEEEKSDV